MSKNINEGIINLIDSKCDCYWLWRIAIRVLKPKKIICKDNLFDSYSLLLASKLEKIPIVGVSHGLSSYWHRGLTGSKADNRPNKLRFDKYYAWTLEMVNMLKNNGHLYLKNQVSN